jgi:hypothetical protein
MSRYIIFNIKKAKFYKMNLAFYFYQLVLLGGSIG